MLKHNLRLRHSFVIRHSDFGLLVPFPLPPFFAIFSIV
jgi:hypothetical protein